jgi:ATP-dependent RNA helicase HelY
VTTPSPDPSAAAGVRAAFVARQDFPLDPFQVAALDALDAGRSVLVAAPTGSGKTVVAEYAVDVALAAGGKAFYTTPIKALSNQKFADLSRRHGRDQVGLLTGDNAVNGDAPVVVMTTEVLRNMIYAASPALRGLHVVVLDEVHYLQDTYRGPVWEEVIIHSPPGVRFVCLSATVSNAEELTDWIATVRGPTDAVIETRRPVELVNTYLVGDKSTPHLHFLPTLVDGRPNPEGPRFDADSLRTAARSPRGRPRRRWFTPNRLEVVDRLADEDLLPAIHFIFSRAACADAVSLCLDAGIRLTAPDERARIRAIVEERVAGLSDADLSVLGYGRYLAALEAGIASHHAGMVPPFKEAVEACFVEGLVKVVFATETLALGINMPARTVVIDKLTKFTGERHEALTPADYTQLTGRAGRRGIDPLGHAVVLWSPFVGFDQVAALASSRSFRLRSAFRPTYNMAANLVARYEPGEAHALLNRSFAQYQTDRSVVDLETRLARRRAVLAELERTTVDRPDVAEYARLLAASREAGATGAHHGAIETALSRVRPGTVLDVRTTTMSGPVAVLTYAVRARRSGDGPQETRLKVVNPKRRVVTLTVPDFHDVPVVVGEVELPQPFAPHNRSTEHRVADQLRRFKGGRSRPKRAVGDMVGHARRVLEEHPLHAHPDRDVLVGAYQRAERIRREVDELLRSVTASTATLARRFDRVLALLEAWGHLDGWALTDKGRRLGRIYHECDLLLAEAIDEGLFDDLGPAALAGLVSVFGYEHRSATPPPPPWFPSADVRDRYHRIEALTKELHADEAEADLPLTRPPDATFLALAHAWAAGDDLDTVLDDEDVSAGDFVRVVKQIVDLLRQLGQLAPRPDTARAARAAADALQRGVVAASAQLSAPRDAAERAANEDPEVTVAVGEHPGDDPQG